MLSAVMLSCCQLSCNCKENVLRFVLLANNQVLRKTLRSEHVWVFAKFCLANQFTTDNVAMYCRKTPRSINAQNVLFWIRMWTTLAIWFQQLVDFDQSCIKNGILLFWNDKSTGLAKTLKWEHQSSNYCRMDVIAEF